MRNKIPYLALCAILLALCAFAEAQQPGKNPPVGVLISALPSAAVIR